MITQLTAAHVGVEIEEPVRDDILSAVQDVFTFENFEDAVLFLYDILELICCRTTRQACRLVCADVSRFVELHYMLKLLGDISFCVLGTRFHLATPHDKTPYVSTHAPTTRIHLLVYISQLTRLEVAVCATCRPMHGAT